MTAPEADLELRPAGGEDAERLGELLLAARPAGPAYDDEEVWVAVVAGAVVGFVALTETWLDELYVDPAHRDTGIGSALLGLVQARRPEGFGLWVLADNLRARDFYARHGLVELELTDGSENHQRVPEVRLASLGERPLRHLRRAIDEVDDGLAVLLARRFALAAAVQDHKAAAGGVGGQQARDAVREAEIVRHMARRAPSVDPERLARVMSVVLAEGLEAWHQRPV